MLYFFLKNQLLKIIYPRAIINLKYNNDVVQDKLIASIISFIYLYIIIFFVISALLTLTGLNFITAVSGAASSISILSTGMILGRLEIFAILVIFLPSFWRK